MNDVTKESKAKGPRTAYALFQKEQGSQVLAKHKAGSIGERSQILAAEWKKVSADEKARYRPAEHPSVSTCHLTDCLHALWISAIIWLCTDAFYDAQSAGAGRPGLSKAACKAAALGLSALDEAGRVRHPE